MRPSRGPRAAQETPKDLQNAMQKNAVKNPKKRLRGENALSRRSHFGRVSGPLFAPKICTFF